MNYVAITEVRETPVYQEPKQYTSEDISKIMAEAIFQPIDSFKYQPISTYITIKISEETLKFIDMVATVSSEIFGEKEYKINKLKFRILTEEDYERIYGKLEE